MCPFYKTVWTQSKSEHEPAAPKTEKLAFISKKLILALHAQLL
jgi:hypothetical protein